MRSQTSATLLAALLAAKANGHYIFSQLTVNGAAVGGDYSYIRQNTNTYMPSFTDDIIGSDDLRCNAGAGSASSETYDVVAGDTIGFKLAYSELIEHPGPGFIYMSLADGGDASSYDGSGDWFKVWESGLSGPAGPGNEGNWGTYQKDGMEFTLPTDIPDGEYLIRPEHIGVHEGHVGKAQFYMECAQVRVSGGGSGSPGPMVKIPGLYTAEEVNFDMWTSPEPTSYTMPGPAVWTGGGTSSGSTGSTSNTTDVGTEAEAPVASAAPVQSAAPVASAAAPVYSAAPIESAAAPVESAAAPVYSAPAMATSAAWGAAPAYGAPSTMATMVSTAAAVPSAVYVGAADAEADCGVVYI